MIQLHMCACNKIHKLFPNFLPASTFTICLLILHAVSRRHEKWKSGHVILLFKTFTEYPSSEEEKIACLPCPAEPCKSDCRLPFPSLLFSLTFPYPSRQDPESVFCHKCSLWLAHAAFGFSLSLSLPVPGMKILNTHSLKEKGLIWLLVSVDPVHECLDPQQQWRGGKAWWGKLLTSWQPGSRGGREER